jgi:serine/threonine-protein kinase
MDPHRWETIQAAFDELVALDTAARVARLKALGTTDPDVRAAVESLLAADLEADARLASVESLLSPALAGPQRPDPASPLPDWFGVTGQNVSHFRVLEPLGAGGMGVVYRAEDTRLGRAVALKFLLPSYSLDASAKARFLHEAHSAAALDHPNLCTIYEIGESEDGRLFLAMALYPGETLKTRLARDGPLPVKEVLAITRQIADGLGCAHAAGIVHRDLKPGNVMLLPDGTVKILDFGLAKARDWSVSGSSARLGTVWYMAPEQVRGEAVHGRTDLWALGVVLYEMLTGRKPFGGEHEVAIAHAIIHDEPARPTALRADVPAAVEDIILTLLEKEAARRYATAAQLLDAVRAIAAIDVAPTGPVWRRLLLGRGRKLRLGAAALGVALALAVGWWGVSELGTGAPTIQSLVVLPLANLTGHAEQEYFVEGMHEALTGELSRIGALKVISRTSAMLYKGERKPAPQIARELGVDGLIEGSVAREGDQVRIVVQLIHGPSDKYLWGDSYRRELRGILALQREVAMEIARQVRVRLTSAEERRLAGARAVHPDAYDLYLRGRHFKHQEEDTGWVQARAVFERSVAIDSSFAPAWAGLAMMYALEAYGSGSDTAARARPAVDKALVLDPNLSDAYVSLALVRQLVYWDWKGAEDAFRRALELAPSNWEAHYEHGWLLIRLGRLDEALAAMQRALALDPLSTVARHGVAWVHLFARRYDEAIETLRKGLELHPTSTSLQSDYADALQRGGFTKESEKADKRYYAMCCETSDAEYENLPHVRFRRYLASGERGKALELLRDIERRNPSAAVSFLASRYVQLGDKDQALRMLEQAAERRLGHVNLIKVNPGLDALRSEPRFQALLKQVGLDK